MEFWKVFEVEVLGLLFNDECVVYKMFRRLVLTISFWFVVCYF